MTRFPLILLLCAVPAFAGPSSTPVLVELFTSEGCSSCPPADALLMNLDSTQPLPGTQLIVLSEHVTYWNHDGWTDPYSGDQFTDRQAAYVRRFHLDSSYTPEMVVDGSAEFVGNSAAKALHAFNTARILPKLGIRLAPLQVDSAKLRTRVEIDSSAASSSGDAEVYVVLALRRADSHVERGENSGRHLSHVNVVRSLTKVGRLGRGKNFYESVEVKIPAGEGLSNIRVIAFVQERGQGKILGAVMEDASQR